jgi:subtilisin-like proprotein convertase family protein
MNDVINKMTGSLRSSEGLNEVSEKLNQHRGEDAAGR